MWKTVVTATALVVCTFIFHPDATSRVCRAADPPRLDRHTNQDSLSEGKSPPTPQTSIFAAFQPTTSAGSRESHSPNQVRPAVPPTVTPAQLETIDTPDPIGPQSGPRLLAPTLDAANSQLEPMELVEFRELPLGEAMRAFSEQTELNIVPSAEASKTVVSLYLRNVDPLAALDSMCKAYNLWYRQDEQTGIIRIYTTDEYQRDLSTFREEQTEVFTLLYPNPVDVATAIRDVFGDRVVLNLGTESFDEDDEDLQQRFDRFDLIDERSGGFGLFGGGGGFGDSPRCLSRGRAGPGPAGGGEAEGL